MPTPGPTHSLGSLRHRHSHSTGPNHNGHGAMPSWRHLKPLNHALSALPAGKPPASGAPPVGVLDRSAVPSPSSAVTAAAAPPAPGLAAAPASSQTPDMTTGYLSLALVPLLWGTYNPCIRYLYAEADPLDPASLTAVRTLLSAGALLLPALLGYLYKESQAAWSRRQQQGQQQQQQEGRQPQRAGSGEGASSSLPHLSATLAVTADGAADGVALAAVAPEVEGATGSGAAAPGGRRSLFSEPINGARLGPVLTRTFDSVVLGGLELGLLNFLGTALQVEGLHSTSATRAGFLAEVTAVLTPLVSYMAGYDIPRQMWLAVAVGLVGSTMVAYDTSQARDTQPASAPSSSPAATPGTEANAVAAAGQDAATSGAPLAASAVTPSPSHSVPTDVSALASAAPPSGARAVAEGGSAVGVGVDAAAASMAADTLATPPPPFGAGPLGDGAAGPLGDGAAGTVGDGAASAADALTSVAGVADATTSAVSFAADAASAAVSAATGTVADAAAAAAAAVASSAADAAVDATSAAAATVDAAASVAAAAAAAAAASSGATPLEITGGEAYLLLACFFYSLCTVRMGIYAPRMDTVGLAAMKKVGLSSMSVLWMAATNLQNGAALGSVFSFPDLSSRTPMSIAVLLYSGLGPGALATFLQVSGLSTVPATTAQVIYSMTPLCTAFFAYLILGGETTGPVAWAGGSLIIIAALTAANAQHRQYQQQQKRPDCEAL